MHSHSSVEPIPPCSLTRSAYPGLIATVSKERRQRVVHLAGELDIAARDTARDACVVGDDHHVIVDLAALTFMDSRGYAALTEARESLARRGLSMKLRNLNGQPARLVGLLCVVDTHSNGRVDAGWTSPTLISSRVPRLGFVDNATG